MSAVADTLTLQITRRFQASRDAVFAAFSSMEALKTWLGPEGCSLVGGTMDFRTGGEYLLHLQTPDSLRDLRGTYLEVSPPERLVFTWKWVRDDFPVTTVNVEFAAIGDETELRLSHSAFPDAEEMGGHDYGWNGSFARLDAALAAR